MQSAHETGPIIQYPIHQHEKTPTQSGEITISPMRARGIKRRDLYFEIPEPLYWLPPPPPRPVYGPPEPKRVTGPIVKPAFTVVKPDLTAKPMTPPPDLSPEPLGDKWLTDTPPKGHKPLTLHKQQANEDECETQAHVEPALYRIQQLARQAQREQKGH